MFLSFSIPGVAPEPVSRPKPNTEIRRYMNYEETPGYDRDIDDKEEVYWGVRQKNLSTPEDIRKFSSDYLVDERLARDYVTYLDNLKLKSDKRKAETRIRKERLAVAAAEEEVDEQDQRKRRQSRRRGRKERRVVEEEEEEEEPDIDEKTGQYDHEKDVNDVILNIVEGPDPDEEDEL